MARKARQLDAFGVYAIHQKASVDRPLFKNDDDRERFLGILKHVKLKFKFKLYAYCVEASDAYHLVIDANGSDLSKVMKSINIAYAMYVKNIELAPVKLFKDRYVSDYLTTQEDVWHAILGCQRQGCQIIESSALEMEMDGVLDPYDTGSEMVLCDRCIQSVDVATLRLERIALARSCDVTALIQDKACRDALILEFRRASTLSLKELGLLFGGLSESTICKILKDQCHEAL